MLLYKLISSKNAKYYILCNIFKQRVDHIECSSDIKK